MYPDFEGILASFFPKRSGNRVFQQPQAIALTKGVADFGHGALKLTDNAQCTEVAHPVARVLSVIRK